MTFVPVDGFLSKRCDTDKDHDETEILSWEMDCKRSGTLWYLSASSEQISSFQN